MDGRASPEGRRIQTNGARNEKASRLSRAKHNQSKETKNEQRERQSIHSKSLPLSSLISAASSLCQPSPPQQQEGGIRSAAPVPFRPLFSRGKTLLKSLPLHFFLGKFRGFWVKVWIFREGGLGGVLRISETTLLERFECGQAEGSEGVEVFNCALAGCQDLSREFWFCFSI